MLRLLLSLALASLTARASSPVVVRGDAGDSEYALTFARQNFSGLLAHCQLEPCGLTPRQNEVLSAIVGAGSQMPAARFRHAGRGAPFLVQPQTGEVWFNQDELWQDSMHSVTYDISYATGIWIDVLNDQLKLPVPEVEALKLSLRTGLTSRFFRAPLSIPGADRIEAFTWRRADGSDRLFVRDSDNSTYDFTVLARAAAGCGSELTDWHLHAGHWTFTSSDSGALWLRLDFSQTWKCNGLFRRAQLKLILRTVVRGTSNLIDADSANALVEATDGPLNGLDRGATELGPKVSPKD